MVFFRLRFPQKYIHCRFSSKFQGNLSYCSLLAFSPTSILFFYQSLFIIHNHISLLIHLLFLSSWTLKACFFHFEKNMLWQKPDFILCTYSLLLVDLFLFPWHYLHGHAMKHCFSPSLLLLFMGLESYHMTVTVFQPNPGLKQNLYSKRKAYFFNSGKKEEGKNRHKPHVSVQCCCIKEPQKKKKEICLWNHSRDRPVFDKHTENINLRSWDSFILHLIQFKFKGLLAQKNKHIWYKNLSSL